MSVKERMRTLDRKRDRKAEFYDSELEAADVIRNGSAVRSFDFQCEIRVTPNNSQIKEIKNTQIQVAYSPVNLSIKSYMR